MGMLHPPQCLCSRKRYLREGGGLQPRLQRWQFRWRWYGWEGAPRKLFLSSQMAAHVHSCITSGGLWGEREREWTFTNAPQKQTSQWPTEAGHSTHRVQSDVGLVHQPKKIRKNSLWAWVQEVGVLELLGQCSCSIMWINRAYFISFCINSVLEVSYCNNNFALNIFRTITMSEGKLNLSGKSLNVLNGVFTFHTSLLKWIILIR